MTKTLKKTLAIVVALALCLSAFMGCFSVSAANTDTITATVTGSTVTEGAEEVTVTIDIASTGFAAALLDISFGGLDIKADDDGEPAIAVTSTSDAGYDVAGGTWDSKIVYQHNSFVDGVANVSAANDTNDGIRLIIDGTEEEYADAQLVLTFVTPAVGEYTVAISELEAADYGTYENNAWTNTEDIIETVTINQAEKNVVVNAAHVHEYSKVNYDETNHWNECPADNAVDEGSVTKHTLSEAAEGEDGKWYKSCTCGYSVEVDAPVVECEHANAEYTLDSKNDSAFIYNVTCPDCDAEAWTEEIAIGADYEGSLDTKKNIDPTNDISLIFRFESANIGDYTNLVAVIEKETYAKNVTTPTVSTDFVLTYDTNTAGYYSFSYPGLAPYEMNNAVSCSLYGKNANNEMIKLGVIEDYSVNAYVKTILTNYASYTSTAVMNLKKALVDLLNYGAMAQTLAVMNVNNLANANLTETELSWGTQESEYCTPDGTAWSTLPTAQGELEGATDENRVTVSRNLNPAEKVYLQFILKTHAADISKYSVKFDYFDIKGNSVTTGIVACTDIGYTRATDGAFVCEFDKAPISTFDYPVTATFYCDGVAVYEDIYSIETYIKTYCGFATNSNVAYANIGKFVQSIYAHGRSIAVAANVTSYMDSVNN